MIFLNAKFGFILLLSILADACDSRKNSSSNETISSITIQELEPGNCDPVMFETKGSGYTGSGYINSPNNTLARIVWSIESQKGGNYKLEFRFANGSSAPRPAQVYVNEANNGKLDLLFPKTENFQTWDIASVNIDFIPGENRVVLQAMTEHGLANIDFLKVTGVNPLPGNCGVTETETDQNSPINFDYLNEPPVGWATQGNGISGGGDNTPVVVDNINDLLAQAAGNTPKVIHVDGIMEGTLTVGSNKTIIGLQGAKVKSDSAVLRITNSSNVIIKNLTFKGLNRPKEQNTVLHNAQNVWLDHNSFIDGYGNLIEISGTSDFITLSWNVFKHTWFAHDHTGVNIGRSDKDTESMGHLNVTLHHNLYEKMVNERMPRVRFGKVHTFNNLCLAGTDDLFRSYYAVRPGVDANVLSERNIYKDFIGFSWWWTSEELGAENATPFNYARGNKNSILESVEDVCIPNCLEGPIDIKEHEGVTGKAGFYSNGKAFIPSYSYYAEPTERLEEKIRAGAGAR
ncbi:MAG: hypothetical protein R6W78_03110 [Bacteroidales bacterium]